MKFLLLTFALTFSTTLFGQDPRIEEGTDSVHISSFRSDLSVSLDSGLIYLSMISASSKNSERMRTGDTTITYDDLFVKLDTVFNNDSLYSELRAKAYLWTLKENTKRAEEANPYHEKGTHQMCIEIWRQSHSYEVKVIERCFYRVIGETQYIWNPLISDFYYQIRDLEKILKK